MGVYYGSLAVGASQFRDDLTHRVKSSTIRSFGVAHSSRGPGRGPLKAETGVRIPYGPLFLFHRQRLFLETLNGEVCLILVVGTLWVWVAGNNG